MRGFRFVGSDKGAREVFGEVDGLAFVEGGFGSDKLLHAS